MQTDGNLVLYHTGVPTLALWNSGTYGASVQGVTMQTDGNLVIYNTSGAAIWHTYTWDNPGAYLTVQDDGNVVVYAWNGLALWHTVTWDGDHSPEKRLWTDRWYQFYEDSYNYTTWMTLSTHRHVDSGYATNWDSPITAALADWNSETIAPNTVYFAETSPPDPEHDVHIAVTSNTASDPDCFTDFGVRKCTSNALGVTYLFDQLKHECQGPGYAGDCDGDHSKPNTWWYALVLLDDDQHSADYQRRETTAHELGHAIVLAHDNSPGNGEVRDYVCGDPRPTVMDYDCALDGDYDGPQLWDSCGINHAYYDPNWGWSGC
ncbi:MAG: hypothetical protein HYY03_06980 [Chloroflexi bacterium]|nr:hypothetical protein [Chloroflexota bacterium]